MFKLLNLHNSNPLEIEVSHNGVSLVFTIGYIVNKRNKGEYDDKKQFLILESYLDWKGEKFKSILMEEYIKAENVINNIGSRSSIDPLPYEITFNILNLVTLEEMFHFVKNVYKLKPLSSLDDVFDESRVLNGRGTRVQTYTKDDYLELVSLAQIMKLVIGPIGEFAYFNYHLLSRMHINYTLFPLIEAHPIAESAPFVKLHGLLVKAIEAASTSSDEANIRTIEKQVSKDELPNWVLSITLMQKIALATIVDDTPDKNIITTAYSFINNKLKVKGDVTNSIRAKKPMVDLESGDNDSESMLESYRIVSELPPGFIVEMKYAIDQIYDDPTTYIDKFDMGIFEDAKNFVSKLYSATITKSQVLVLSWIFKDHTDPRSIFYVPEDRIIKLMALGFTYLWVNGYKELALIITATPTVDENISRISFSTNRSRVTKELMNRLDVIFPYQKVTVSKKEDGLTNVVTIPAQNVSSDMNKHRWSMNADVKYRKEVTGNESATAIIPPDMKIQLLELILHINS